MAEPENVNIADGANASDKSYFHLTPKVRELHWLREPHGSLSHYLANLRYQMQYSVTTLEEQLCEEGNPHVLILYTKSHRDKDPKNPDVWQLSADGNLVASGDGKFARECFYESGERFREVCREAIEAADLPKLSSLDYYLLRCSRNIQKALRGELDETDEFDVYRPRA